MAQVKEDQLSESDRARASHSQVRFVRTRFILTLGFMDQQVATDMRASEQRIAAASDQARAMRVVFRFRNVESLQSVHLLNLSIEKSSSSNNNNNDNTEYHRPITECN